jgi:hypothetical protein
VILIAIDPGVRLCGLAVFQDGALKSARLVRSEEVSLHLGGAETVVCEMPQAYRGRAARGDTNDILALARVVGAIEGAARLRGAARFLSPHPREWKGQVPKDIMCRRVWNALRPEERAGVALSSVALA